MTPKAEVATGVRIDPHPDTTEFERHRRHLRALAYRMLGSRAEAEDVVQDCWLRWRSSSETCANQGPGSAIEQPRAWLSRVATNLCLDRLQSARARREQYVGVWLPEPLLDEHMQAYDAGPEAHAEHAQQISIAFMLALQRLSPLERAAFLLHDVFDVGFEEVAQRLGRSAAACRQLAARARAHVQAGQARVDVAHEDAERLLMAFAQAVSAGDVDALSSALAADVRFLSDGGGQVAAVPRPVVGAAKVAQVFIGFARLWDPAQHRLQRTRINGLPGVVLFDAAGHAVQTLALQLARDSHGRARVAAIYVTRNPRKLAHLDAPGMNPSADA